MTNATLESDRRHLVFKLAADEFAIPLIAVKEVIAVPDLVQVPFSPKFVLGLMNVRGQVITVIDLRLRLSTTVSPITAESAVIICEANKLRIGILVDNITQVINPKLSEIHATPEIERNGRSKYIEGIYRKDTQIVSILNITSTIDIAASVKSTSKAA